MSGALIELRRVRFRHGAREILRDIDLAIERGEFIGICGVSGSGKSTLARLLTLHADPGFGERLLDGRDVSRKYGRNERRRLQLVFQDPGASLARQWTVRRILEEAARAGAVREGLDAAALLETVRMPREFLERRAGELSGGQRRRIALARAFSARPDLLVLDESFSGLDFGLQDELLTLLDTWRRERNLAVALISHEPRLIERAATRMLVIEEGRIVEQGRTAAIFANPQHNATRAMIEAERWV